MCPHLRGVGSVIDVAEQGGGADLAGKKRVAVYQIACACQVTQLVQGAELGGLAAFFDGPEGYGVQQAVGREPYFLHPSELGFERFPEEVVEAADGFVV